MSTPGAVCPSCGSRALRVAFTHRKVTTTIRTLRCLVCEADFSVLGLG